MRKNINFGGLDEQTGRDLGSAARGLGVDLEDTGSVPLALSLFSLLTPTPRVALHFVFC